MGIKVNGLRCAATIRQQLLVGVHIVIQGRKTQHYYNKSKWPKTIPLL